MRRFGAGAAGGAVFAGRASTRFATAVLAAADFAAADFRVAGFPLVATAFGAFARAALAEAGFEADTARCTAAGGFGERIGASKRIRRRSGDGAGNCCFCRSRPRSSGVRRPAMVYWPGFTLLVRLIACSSLDF